MKMLLLLKLLSLNHTFTTLFYYYYYFYYSLIATITVIPPVCGNCPLQMLIFFSCTATTMAMTAIKMTIYLENGT